MTKRVTAALMAALVIMTTTYNVYTVNVNAAEVVVGETLVELLIAFLASLGITYMGNVPLDQLSQAELEEMIYNTCCGNPDLFFDYANSLVGAGYLVTGSIPVDPSSDEADEAIEAILVMPAAGILVNEPLMRMFMSDDLAIKTDTGSKFYHHYIDEAVAQDFYFVNPILPEYVYIGYNSSLISGTAVLANYDTSVTHLQYYNAETACYRDIQVPRQNADRWAGETIEAACYINYSYDILVHAGSLYYMFAPGSYLRGTNVIDSLISYVYGSNGYYAVNNKSYQDLTLATEDYPIYISPVFGQPALIDFNRTTYLIYSDGTIFDGTTKTAPSGVVTDDDILNSVDSIVGGIGFGSYLALLFNSLCGVDSVDSDVESGTVVSSKSIGLSKEAIDHISNVANEYYQTTVENYYQDISYIDGDTYIENITNIYEQAAVEYPAIEIPDIAIDDTGIISAIKAIPGQIAKVVADIFIPDLAMTKGYVGSIMNHFSWMREPWDFFRVLIDMIFVDNNDPPVIYIDLSKAESSYIYGGKTVLIDFAFWERYKPLADTIIVGFCYIWFAYWFFRNLPEIISGVSPVPVFRSSERAAARIQDAVLKSDPEYGRVKVDDVGSISSSKGVHYSGARSAHHNIQDDQMRPKT